MNLKWGASCPISSLIPPVINNLVHFFLASLPSLFTTLLYGSMSDATGRKPMLLCAIIGGLIKCFIVSMTVTLGMQTRNPIMSQIVTATDFPGEVTHKTLELGLCWGVPCLEVLLHLKVNAEKEV